MKRSSSKGPAKEDSVPKENSELSERVPLGDITKGRPATRKRRRPLDVSCGLENSTGAENEVNMTMCEPGPVCRKPRLVAPAVSEVPVVTTQNYTRTLRKFPLLACAMPAIAAFLALDSGLPYTNSSAHSAPLQATDSFAQFDFLSQFPLWSARFAAGIQKHAREWELKYRVTPDYLTNAQGFTAQHRAQMVNAMLNFTRGRSWTQLTVHLAVNLLDRFLSAVLSGPALPRPRVRKQPATISRPADPRLCDASYRTVVVATMLWMAYKLEERQVGFNFAWLKDLPRDLGGPVPSKEAVVRCECRVVAALDYHLTAPTAQVYLTMLAAVADLEGETYSLAKCLAERCLLEHTLLRFLPSELACAAVHVARTLQLQEDGGHGAVAEVAWTPALQGFTGRTLAGILPCATAVLEILQRETDARARLHAHSLLVGTDYTLETLLRTLQHLAGNNTRHGAGGWVLQPYSPTFPNGRISEKLQAYHDILPALLLRTHDAVLREVGHSPLPTPEATPVAVQDDPADEHTDVLTATSATSVTTAPVLFSQPSQQASQASVLFTPPASGGFQFRIFGRDVLSAVTAPRAALQQESFLPLSQMSQLTAEESHPFRTASFSSASFGSASFGAVSMGGTQLGTQQGTASFPMLSLPEPAAWTSSDSFPFLPDALQLLASHQQSQGQGLGLGNLYFPSARAGAATDGGFAAAVTVTAATLAASDASTSGTTTAPGYSQTTGVCAAVNGSHSPTAGPSRLRPLRRIASASSDEFPVTTQDAPAVRGRIGASGSDPAADPLMPASFPFSRKLPVWPPAVAASSTAPLTLSAAATTSVTALTPRSAAPQASQPPALSRAAPVLAGPVLHVPLPPEVQRKYQLYPATTSTTSPSPSQQERQVESLLTLALRDVAALEPVYDCVLLRYRHHYRRLVACPPPY